MGMIGDYIKDNTPSVIKIPQDALGCRVMDIGMELFALFGMLPRGAPLGKVHRILRFFSTRESKMMIYVITILNNI